MNFKYLVELLRDNGIKVKFVDGWKHRTAGGTFKAIAAMFHHTASAWAGKNLPVAPALAVVTHGRSDLPGPLCQMLVGRDSTAYIIAKGRANHAGTGGPFRNIPADSGNAYTFGVEVENNGVGEPWDEKFRDDLATIFACILIAMGKDEEWLLGHKTWTTRKIDPAGIDIPDFRGRVKRKIKHIKDKDDKKKKGGKR